VNAAGLSRLLEAALERLEGAREELRALDAAIGDGDLGITVAGGAAAVRSALREDAGDTPTAVLRTAARSFAKANPSTMSGLVAAALLAASKELRELTDIDRAAAERLLDITVTTIQARGGAEIGDKTVLDGLAASAHALRAAPASPSAALVDMVRAAQKAVEQTTDLQSQRGRAAWVGERSIGHPDGGAVAYVRLLESLSASWPNTVS
jgi:dihydroxyacetone kinase